MTATNHVLTGALIATAVHNPFIALPLALISHFALDALPHFDAPAKPGVYDVYYFKWLAVDCGLAASILLTLLLLQPPAVWLLMACGIVAASPDLMWIYYLLLRPGSKPEHWPWLVRFHAQIQKHTSPKMWPVELAWFLAVGGLLAIQLQP
jgi:hypothetical protein